MKISKLTIAALLTIGLVVTGCNNKKKSSSPSSSEPSSSQQAGVDKIKVTSLNRSLIVGEEINLDDYVSVVGGEGEKVYTASLKEGSESVVSLNGKTLKALAEGEFTVLLKAGQEGDEKTANFSGKAMIQLRADLEAVLQATTEGYAMQQFEYTVDSIDLGDLNIHKADYYAGPDAVKNEAGTAYIPGGMLKAANGKTYEFAMDDMAGTNLTVRPSVLSDFSHWSTQIDINFDVSLLDLHEDEEGKYFTLSYELPVTSASWEGVFENMVDQMVGAMFDASPASAIAYFDTNYPDYHAAYLPLEIRPVALSETATAFAVICDIALPGAGDDVVANVATGYIITEDVPDIAPVRAYIDAGNFPDPIPFTEYTTKAQEAITAKNFAYQIKFGFFRRSDFAYYGPANAPAILTALGIAEDELDDYCNLYDISGTETGVVTEHARYSTTNKAVYESGAQTGWAAEEFGYIEHAGSVYQFKKSAEAESYTTTDQGVTNLWTAADGLFMGTGLIPGEDFEVATRNDLGEGYYGFTFNQGSDSIAQLAEAAGYLGRYNFYSESQQEYMLAYLQVSPTGFIFVFGVYFGSGIMYGAQLQVASIGAAELPAGLEDAIFPAA